ncbi:MAG: hypothetical protein WCT10_00925 [Patescibacteria group bacterium]|jgi:hypothetical protein
MDEKFSDEISYARKLIRGRIAEVLFEQMIRKEGRYTVIPFGYEHTLPTLAQYRHFVEIEQVINNISDAPDFVLISSNKKEVYLVEVKYQTRFDIEQIVAHASKLLDRWNPSWLFVATPEAFYCSPCSVIAGEQRIGKLTDGWVETSRQSEYLKLLGEFRCSEHISQKSGPML